MSRSEFYDPEEWRTVRLNRWPSWPIKVEFDGDEAKMLGELCKYTGFSRDFIAREAVRYFYEEWYLKQPRESGVYYKCHEQFVWEDGEVKKGE